MGGGGGVDKKGEKRRRRTGRVGGGAPSPGTILSRHIIGVSFTTLGKACRSRLFKAEPRGRERHRVAFKCVLGFFGTVQISQTAVMLSPTTKIK